MQKKNFFALFFAFFYMCANVRTCFYSLKYWKFDKKPMILTRELHKVAFRVFKSFFLGQKFSNFSKNCQFFRVFKVYRKHRKCINSLKYWKFDKKPMILTRELYKVAFKIFKSFFWVKNFKIFSKIDNFFMFWKCKKINVSALFHLNIENLVRIR